MNNKILIPFVGDSIGGSHKSILETYGTLKKMNANIVLLLHKAEGPLSKYLLNKKINYEVLNVKRLSGEKPSIINIFITNILNFRKFKKYLIKNDITLVHGNDLRINLSWAIPAYFAGCPFIWHQRTLISNSYWWLIIKYISTKYLVTSKTIKSISPSNIDDIKILPNPVSSNNSIRKKNIINKEKITLGYCGRVVKEKNIESLIESFLYMLSKNNYNYELLIAGRGDENFVKFLKNKFTISEETKIKFIGFVENPYYFISNLDILICPSLIDGFGRTIIESMSVETPVIAANAGGHKDLILNNNNGLLYNPNDKENLLLKINSLIDNEKLRLQIITNGKKLANEFDNNIISTEIFKLYRELHNNIIFSNRINILHIDIEGGWGGSSKSLFELTKVIHNKYTNSSIIIGQKGKIANEYNKLNIYNHYIGNLYSFVPRKKNSFKIFLKNLFKLLSFPKSLRKIIKIAKLKKTKVIHLNYEGLFLYGLFIKLLTNNKIVIHMRTLLPEKNIFSYILIKMISKYCADYIFFISKNEKERFFKDNLKSKIKGSIMENIFHTKHKVSNYSNQKEYTIIYLGNISYNKGVDRLIELAKYFKSKNNSFYRIRIYGVARNNQLYFNNLKEQINLNNLKNIEFKEHTLNVIDILKNSFILIRPSRDNDPWGRDIIEAASIGLPVIATGVYDNIIKHGKNGYLLNEYSNEEVYKYCEELRKNQFKWNAFRDYSLNNIRKKYIGNVQEAIFNEAIKSLYK